MPPFNPVTIARRALAAVVFNTVLALAITAVSGETLAVNMVYSQFIGLLIWGLIDGGRFVLHPSGWPGARAMAGLVIGAVLVAYPLGSAIANALLGRPLLIGLNHFPRATLGFVLMSLSAGGFGAYYFTSRELLARARLAGEEAQRQATEARLKLLESQLEPHMLFNTLANLRVLIGTDPARAQDMLDRMIAYLRATLTASRSTEHPLAHEFDRLRDYLELMAVRMGPRLAYTLDLPEPLREAPVPPLLLQPLVENAIRHGLEPKVEGGHILVRAHCTGADGRTPGTQRLVIEVTDTGVGLPPVLPPAGPGQSFGLAQARERLATLYGADGTIDLIATSTGGTSARAVFPLKLPSQP